MPMSQREAYRELASFESIALEQGEYIRDYGVARLRVRRVNKLIFEYVWGERVVQKHIALSAVQTFGEASR